MRWALGLFAAILVTVTSASWASDGRLVVHEWGTFTSFSGSDGVHLEFRPLVENDLPDFVFDRARLTNITNEYFTTILTKREVRAPVRMETPVTYFYTDQVREVDVSVAFPSGLLTEFYPPVREITPEYEADELPVLKQSSLNWGKLRLLPEKDFRALRADFPLDQVPPSLPAAGGNDHYAAARETDSAIVEFADVPFRHGNHYEKFLFYRGVGNFELPLSLKAKGGDQFELTNSGNDPVRSLFLVAVEGESIRFSRFEQIDGQSQLAMQLAGKPSSVDQLAEAVVTALVAEGLYEKEARAMVKTWRDSWFAEQGTRLFYMVPPRLTDEYLPIQIEPQPDEMVRVLVGRLEILSPEQEQQIAKLAVDCLSELPDVQQTATDALSALGRFAEPALERVHHKLGDDKAREHAAALILKIGGEQ